MFVARFLSVFFLAAFLLICGITTAFAVDRADTPASFGDATHTVTATMKLGANVDDDAAAIFSATATGDGADDDGVTLPTLLPGANAEIIFTVTGNGRLSAWFDWNADGDFIDAGERMMTNLTDNGGSDLDAAAGVMRVSIAIPTGAAAASFARFRWNAANLASPTVAGGNGETEDYAVTVIRTIDRGDAAAGYGDATHVIVAGLRMGASTPDANTATVFSAAANGDDTSATDDEDGVTINSFTQNYNTAIPVTVTGAGGLLQAWIDWNGDSDFNDAGEQVATNVSDNGVGDTNAGAGTITLSVLTPSSALTGTRSARFRWSTSSGLAPAGHASSGEVEDYTLTVAAYMAATGATSCSGSDLATNGSFETPDYNVSPPNYRMVATVPGWSNSAEGVIEVWDTGFNATPAHTGNQLAELNANVAGTLSTTANGIIGGGEYVFFWAHRGRAGTDTASLSIVDNGGGSLTYGNFSTGNGSWTVRSATQVAAPTATAMTASFAAVSTASGDVSVGNFLDTVEICQTAITLTKSFSSLTDVDSNGIHSAGDLITYQYAIASAATNFRAMTAIQLFDDKIGTLNITSPASGDTNGNGILNPGETWIVTATYPVTQADINTGSVTNIAYARGNTGANVLQSANRTVNVPLVTTPQLSIVKSFVFLTDSGDLGEANTGDTLRFTYVVTNNGNVGMTGVHVDDTHNHTGSFLANPSNAALTDNAPSGDSSGVAGSNVWATLAPKDVVTFTQDYTVTQTDIDTLQ